MGTNYYLVIGYKKCPTCGAESEDERIHIGKSSYGWYFSLHVYPERNIDDLEAWKFLFHTATIRSSDGETLNPAKMLEIITEREIRNRSNPHPVDSPWWSRNEAEPGCNGLARFKVDGVHCVGHGSGPWSYMIGEFC